MLSIWLVHPDPNTNEQLWLDFQRDMNSCIELTWEFTQPAMAVDFMDLHISIEDTRLVTTLHEKPLNLHLCAPLHPILHTLLDSFLE